VLTHCDYWSGNVVWRDGRLTGIVDWSDGSRGPSGFDLGWCRLDLLLLFDEQIADDFLAAYEAATGQAVGEMRLWDTWAAARSDERLGPGPRTTCRWAAPTSMKLSFGDAMRNGRRASESGRKPQHTRK
jgi:Ser/Thr protein kinase RdoA (MazF antagonist)